MELLSPNDLELPWKKLYDTYERLQYNRDEFHGLISIPESVKRRLSEAILLSRVYFAQDATQEMLDEWRPFLCPHSSSMKKAIRYLNLFLPTLMRKGQETWKLWFDEIMGQLFFVDIP